MFSALKSLTTILLMAFLLGTTASAEDTSSRAIDSYLIQPGDMLVISVWKEEDMNQLAVVRPDGYITFPLAGETKAAGDSIEALRLLLGERLEKYIPDPVVTVSVQELAGNTIYVLGKVNRPGVFPMSRNTDVMQALSIAGGTATYAALNKIKILRRENGKLIAIPFEYGDVEKGKHLEQNILLKAGDVLVIP